MYTFLEPEMRTAGQRVLLTITALAFFSILKAGQQTQRGRCPIEQRGEFISVRGGLGLGKGTGGLERGHVGLGAGDLGI